MSPKTIEVERQDARDECWFDMIECINQFETKEQSIERMERLHKKFIHKMNVKGKRKYKTLDVLHNYFANPDPRSSKIILMNTLNKRMLSEEYFETLSEVAFLNN